MDVLMPFNPDCEPAPPLREPASFLQSPLPPMPITIGPDQAIAHAGWTSALSTVLAETLAGPCLVEVVGPAGTGKTLLLEAVARMLRDGGVDEHLHMRGDSGLLNKGAVAEAARRNRVVLIDEADRVGPEVLRSIRGGASGGCAWVLASKTVPLMLPAARAPGAQAPGAQTPGPLASGLLASGLLASGADDAASRAAAPRITVVRLAPLPAAETRAFVDARLARIGLSGRLLTDAAVAELARCSGGVPRVVNMLLGAALFLAHSEAAPAVDREHVEGAAALRNLDAVVEAGRPGPPHAQGPLHALAANTAAFSSGLPSRPADPVRPVDPVRPADHVRPAKADVRSVPDPLAADLQLASLPATGQPSISQPSTEQPVVKAEPVADEALVPAADPAAPAGSDAPVQPDASARTEASGEPDAAVGPAAHAASGPAAHAATGTAASPDPAMRPGVASAHDPAPPAAIDAPLDASPWMCAPVAQAPAAQAPADVAAADAAVAGSNLAEPAHRTGAHPAQPGPELVDPETDASPAAPSRPAASAPPAAMTPPDAAPTEPPPTGTAPTGTAPAAAAPFGVMPRPAVPDAEAEAALVAPAAERLSATARAPAPSNERSVERTRGSRLGRIAMWLCVLALLVAGAGYAAVASGVVDVDWAMPKLADAVRLVRDLLGGTTLRNNGIRSAMPLGG